jgi:hypothetical protein
LDMELIDEVNTDHDALKDNDSKPEEQNTTRPVASKISVKAGDETESNEQDDATGKSKSRGTDVLPTLKTVAELDARFAANLAKASKTTASKTIVPKVKTREELDADFAANLARSVANTRSKRTEKHQPTYSADRTHEDVQNYVSTSKQPKSDQLTLSVYWDETFWRRFVTEDVVTISKISASLGVRAQSARKMKDLATGQAQANDHPFIFKLEVETNRIASNLHAKLSTDELVKTAAYSNSLVEEIDVLLADYAPNIWGMDADRSKLLTPDRGRIYVKHLTYENDEDRKSLRLHLHQWICAKAFDYLRRLGDSQAGSLDKLQQKKSSGTTSAVSGGKHVSEELQSRNKTGKVHRDELKGPIIATNPIKSTPRKRPASITTQDLPGQKKHKAPKPSAQALTSALLAYLAPNTRATAAEPTFLDTLEAELLTLTPHLPILLPSSFAATFPAILTAFLRYRRTIHSVVLRSQMQRNPELSDVVRKISHSRFTTKLSVARDGFMACHFDVGRVLCVGFDALQGVEGNGGLRKEIEEGMRGLDEDLVRFGDGLVKGGGSWVVMG